MAIVDVEVNGRSYQIACDDGQEEHLKKLSIKINKIVKDLVDSMGQVGDARLILMAALLLADEISDNEKINISENLPDISDQATQSYNLATKRILDVAAKLNK
ncbi:MAG: cell division protein ZapA [Rhodospirillaceae bacterium]|nr:cell division protein ZapA [Rhodospirillaceae bacterium]|tara:strand:+ start:123 stop:431 length:309 start_codon:yes stop_codon:yes gene_type:complete